MDKQIYGVPKVTCLCATKGRYELLRSSISYFLLQDYPNKELIIFNNHATPMELSPFLEKQGNIRLINGGEFDSIAEVYTTALTHVDENTTFVSIWDDDDIYLPWHISTGVKYLANGEKLAWQPKDQLGIDENHEQYPKIHALRNNCEGSIIVQYKALKEAGFGPEEGADENNQQHPHPVWTHHVNQNGGFVYSDCSENSYVYFWGDKNRGKPWYVHLTNGNFAGNIQNSDTGHGKPLYPGPTYYNFLCANLWQKTWETEYTEHERIALVERINSYDWEYFEERKLFTFWEGEKPYFIEKCLESMERNSNCLFEVWDTEKLRATFSDIPVEYDSLCVEFKSDYARQRILAERGGMWLDADMFVVADLHESVLSHTWSYDQVQPLENNGCSSVNICAMACRPKSQVFKKAMESVNAVMPLRIGWGDLLNTPTKHAIREGHTRGLVKYIPEPVVSLRFVQSPHGGFDEIYSSTTIPLEEIVLDDTAVVTLHSSQIRHHQKDLMPKDYLLQRLINKYLSENSETCLSFVSPEEVPHEGELVSIVKEAISDSMKNHSNLDFEGKLPNGCPAAMSSPKIKHLVNSLFSRMPKNTHYLEIGTWEGGILIPALYKNDHLNVSVIDIFTDPNGVEAPLLDKWEYHTPTKENFFRNLDVYLPNRKSIEVHVRDCFEDNILQSGRKYKIYLYDGPHDKESQKKALTHYANHLEDVFVYLVDDYLDVPVQEGTREAIAEAGLEVLYSQPLFSRYNGDNENYWNGFGVFVFKKREIPRERSHGI
mgnify:CR=1 FL=1